MKHDWEYKKFESCLEKVVYTKKLQSSDYLKNGIYPIVSQEEGLISGYWNCGDDVFKLTKPIVVFGDHTRVLKYVDFNFVIGADGVKILQPKNELVAKFLFYYLKWYDVPSLGYSRHYKLLKECSIPVPPLPIQHQIVAELDKVSEIIEKKKQQVKELDNLAQSIFYDMFGDPVENEKGWEVKKMGEVCQVVAGGDKPKDISEMRTEEYKYPVIANGEGKKGILGYSKSYRIADKSVTIGARGASIGNCRLQQEQFTPVVRLIVLTPIDDISCNYLYYYSKNSIFDINGAGQAQLTVPNVKSMSISLPPLPLQQSFAQKIEAIEKQKELINQSIKETQTLFDARMDYWFGE